MAITAGCDRMVAAFHPAIVVWSHNVTIGAGLGARAEIGKSFTDVKRVAAKPKEQAGTEYRKNSQSVAFKHKTFAYSFIASCAYENQPTLSPRPSASPNGTKALTPNSLLTLSTNGRPSTTSGSTPYQALPGPL